MTLTTPQAIRDALTHISPDLPRDDWVKVGMAIKAGLNGDGFELFADWSHGGQTYNWNDTRDTWRSIDSNGGVTVGTLFFLAGQNGWQRNVEVGPVTATDRQARERERTAQAAKTAQVKAHMQQQAARKAAALWAAATPAQADYPYLVRKGIAPVAALREITVQQAVKIIGYAPKSDGEPLAGRLLVALVEIDGQVSTAELIDEVGRKSAIAGGAKSGGYWAAQPLPDDDRAGQILTIGEGIATVLSEREATGHLAVAALSAGNLPKVAQAMRNRYPAAVLLVLADLGNGQAKAEEAARATQALLVVPDFTGLNAGEEDTDFNDLHRLASLEEVRRQIQAARLLQKTPLPIPAVKTNENLFSDYGNIIKLTGQLNDRIAYTPGLGWLLYNPENGVWEPEPGSERVKRLVLETLREAWIAVLYSAQSDEADLKKQLKTLDNEDPMTATINKRVKLARAYREEVFRWIRQCETAYRIRSTLELAEGYFWTDSDVWDSNPNILVCGNGVLDLHTGRLLPHSPSYHATKTTGTDYRHEAAHPAWDAALSLLKAEGDRYEFVHQFCGSGLYGKNPNERVVIFQGDGGTGKGTLLTAIHRAMGDYVATVEVGSLLATDWRKQNKSAPREDLLKLRGARFVYPSIEPPKDSKLDDGSIKALTGNDAITARYPHSKNSITFMPVFKLIIQTNFPLQTEFDDPGMKRRVIVVPFNKKPVHPDPTIKNDLMHDPNARAAVLAWLYEGCRAWLANGYALPDSTLASQATADYWVDMNPYAQFAHDAGLKFGKGLKCLKPKMTGAFRAWREETGRRDATTKGFPAWLRSMGCYDAQAADLQRYWHGVEFVEDSLQP